MKASNRNEYRFLIEYYVFPENDYQIAYCPSLDISTSGKDYNDAVKNFYERFQIYIETCLEMGTLKEDLQAHGWTVSENSVVPPTFRKLARKQEMLRLLEGHTCYEKISTPMRIPAIA